MGRARGACGRRRGLGFPFSLSLFHLTLSDFAFPSPVTPCPDVDHRVCFAFGLGLLLDGEKGRSERRKERGRKTLVVALMIFCFSIFSFALLFFVCSLFDVAVVGVVLR